jgi:electron transport complex protein RnfG
MNPHARKAVSLLPLLVLILLVVLTGLVSRAQLLGRAQNFDRNSLQQFFAGSSFDNDVLFDAYLIPAAETHPQLVNLDLLGLQRDRLAYRARQEGDVIAVAVPATVDDGFNGSIDLLISIDMFGRIGAARVIEDLQSDALYGVLETIESKWMEEFSGSSMRDILGISWSTITADREYDQFVGASITPKAVSNRIYDALVFFQSNRIELMRGQAYEL